MTNFKLFYGTVSVPLTSSMSRNTSAGCLVAIIGPNGSGKSSIVDALLFVLGHRSTDIRADKLAALVNEHAVNNARLENSGVVAASVSLHGKDNDRKSPNRKNHHQTIQNEKTKRHLTILRRIFKIHRKK